MSAADADVVWAWFTDEDGQTVRALADELATRGLELRPFAAAAEPHGEPVYVFLSDAFLDRFGDELEAAATAGQALIPIRLASLTAAAAPRAIKDLSWLDARDLNATDLAGRVAVRARTVPEWAIAWDQLLTTARRAHDEPTSAQLLNQRELDRAIELVARRPSQLIPEVPPPVVKLFAASQRRLRRRRVLVVAIGGAIASLLFAAAVVAGLQRHSAVNAQSRARAAAAHSEGDRLARLSRQYLNSEPDLPVILAARAYALEQGPVERDSLQAALDGSPWHRSYRLNGSPFSVATNGSSRLVAIARNDGVVDVIDARSGTKVGSAALPTGSAGIPVVAMSADGRSLALAYNGGLLQLRRLAAGLPVTWSKRVAGLSASNSNNVSWLGSRELLTTWSGSPALRISLPDGRVAPVQVRGLLDPVGGTLSPDHRLVALVDEQHVALLNAATWRPCWVSAEPGRSLAVQVVFARNDYLVIARQGTFALQIPIPAACATPGGARTQGVAWPPGNGSAAAALINNGDVAVGTAYGTVVVASPGALYPVGRFYAHVGAVTGVGVVAGDSLVTVGADRWLRVWQTRGTLPSFPIGPAWNVNLNERYGNDAARATWRPMIAIDAAGRSAMTGGLSSGRLTDIAASAPAVSHHSAFIAINASIRPVPDRRCSALVITLGGFIGVVSCNSGRNQVVWRRSHPVRSPTLLQSAVSDDGRFVALAEFGTVEITDTKTNTTRVFHGATVASLMFDHSAQLFVVGLDGTVVTYRGLAQVRQVALPLNGDSVRSAAVSRDGGRLVAVTASGRVVEAQSDTGALLQSPTIGANLASVISVRLSADARFAVIVARTGYWVVDLDANRVILSSAGYTDTEIGAEPRDAVFTAGGRSLLVLTADESVARVPIDDWRLGDGRALLKATTTAVPRVLAPSEAAALGLDQKASS